MGFLKKRLDVFEMKSYRWLLEIRWNEQIKNEDFRLGVEEVILCPIVSKIDGLNGVAILIRIKRKTELGQTALDRNE